MDNRLKDRILQLLYSSIPAYISGEAISSHLGITRTAVWKHIKQLKNQGYIIKSSTKKGYRLEMTCNVMNRFEILNGLRTQLIAKEMHYFDNIDSTNNYAKKKATEGCSNGTVVLADCQSAGRGRLGRLWSSPRGKGIWISAVLKPDILPSEMQIITIAASVAVIRALEKSTGIRAGIKWPNDIILNDKKVCGILTEMNCELDAINFIILGIGINVNHIEQDFEEDIKNIAISLSQYMLQTGEGRHQSVDGLQFSRSAIVKELLVELEAIYQSVLAGEKELIINEWKKYSVTLGRQVTISSKAGEMSSGMAKDIDNDGSLIIINDSNQELKILAGEISIRGVLGHK